MPSRPSSSRRYPRIAVLLFGLAPISPGLAQQPAEDAGHGEPGGIALGAVASDLDMAEAQIDAREYAAARDWLEAHLQDLERGTHRYDARLIRPLTLLGDAHMGEGAYAEALRHYQRATHLTRVNAGLKSPEQVEIVYREAAAYKALGAFKDASDREEYAYRILASSTRPDDPALLAGLYRLADWYLSTGNPFAARGLYERAIGLHEMRGELDDEAAIPALQGLATTYRLERYPSSYAARQPTADSAFPATELQQPVALNNFPAGEQALQQVVRIRQQHAESAPMAVVEAVLDLADWYTLFDKPARAEPLYAHAFELLGAIPDSDRHAYFATPRLLYFPDPGMPRGPRAGTATETARGFIELGFEVSPTGYVRDLQTIAAEPEGLMDLRVRRSMRIARYRPALVDGVPILSTNQLYRHEFTYEAEREAPEEPAEEDAGTAEAESAGTTDTAHRSELAGQ